jgi:hypothetical protein
LQSKQEIEEFHRYHEPDFNIKLKYKRYAAGDIRHDDAEGRVDFRDVVAKLRVDMREMKLAPLQRQRLIFLLGPRYNPKKPHEAKVVIKQYNNMSENFIRANEVLRELYWEALRAPRTNVIFRRNPYQREKMIKKHFGRTKEERKASITRINKEYSEHVEAVKRAEVESDNNQVEIREASRKKRLENAKRRAKLGFKDAQEVLDIDSQGVDDKENDHYEAKKRYYEKRLEEKSERRGIKMPVDINAISNKENADYITSLPGTQFEEAK